MKEDSKSESISVNQIGQVSKILEDSEEDEQLIVQKKVIPIFDNFKLSTYLGFICFGGPVAHIGVFKKVLVDEKEYVSMDEFTQHLGVCSFLPGPTSTQLITSISTVSTNSILGGISCFFGFNMPGMIIILIIWYLLTLFNTQNIGSAQYFYIGIAQGAISLILQAAIDLTAKQSELKPKLLFMMLLSSFFYYIFKDFNFTMIIIMTIGGIINAIDTYLKTNLPNKEVVEPLLEKKVDKVELYKENSISFTGIPSLILFVLTYILLVSLKYSFPNNINCVLMELFFRIGCLIFGGGHVVIPLILNEMIKLKLLEGNQVILSFSIVSLLPGPMFNMAAFVGASINGILSGVISALSLFAPGILLVFTMIPFMQLIKSNPVVNSAVKGISVCAIGFIYTSAYILWLENCYSQNLLIGSANIIVSFFLVEKLRVNVVFVLLLSGTVYLLFKIYFG